MTTIKTERPIRPMCGWERSRVLISNGKCLYKIKKGDHIFYIPTKVECDRFCQVFFGVLTEHFMQQLKQHFVRYSWECAAESKISYNPSK